MSEEIKDQQPQDASTPSKPKRKGGNLVFLLLLGLVGITFIFSSCQPKPNPSEQADNQAAPDPVEQIDPQTLNDIGGEARAKLYLEAVETRNSTWKEAWDEAQLQIGASQCSTIQAMMQEALQEQDKSGTPASTTLMGKIAYIQRRMDNLLAQRSTIAGSADVKVSDPTEKALLEQRYRRLIEASAPSFNSNDTAALIALVKKAAPKLTQPQQVAIASNLKQQIVSRISAKELEAIVQAVAGDVSARSARDLARSLSNDMASALFAYRMVTFPGEGDAKLPPDCANDFSVSSALMSQLRKSHQDSEALKTSRQRRNEALGNGTIKPANPVPEGSKLAPVPQAPFPVPQEDIREAEFGRGGQE